MNVCHACYAQGKSFCTCDVGHPQLPVAFYADGGVLGRNPSAIGVYWSVCVEEPGKASRVLVHRKQDLTHYTNNDAEWLAVQEALTLAAQQWAGRSVVLYSDSRLVVKQFNKVWRSTIARHHRWKTACQLLALQFPSCKVEWKPRAVMVARFGH